MRHLRDGEIFAALFAILLLCLTISNVAGAIRDASTANACISAGGSWTKGSPSEPDTCTQP